MARGRERKAIAALTRRAAAGARVACGLVAVAVSIDGVEDVAAASLDPREHVSDLAVVVGEVVAVGPARELGVGLGPLARVAASTGVELGQEGVDPRIEGIGGEWSGGDGLGEGRAQRRAELGVLEGAAEDLVAVSEQLHVVGGEAAGLPRLAEAGVEVPRRDDEFAAVAIVVAVLARGVDGVSEDDDS